jgi:hypothetical protein
VELYALSFIPQAVAHDPAVHTYLEGILYEDFSSDISINNELVAAFGKMLRSMRITCEDLGDVSHASSQLQSLVNSICEQISVKHDTKFMAAYQTTYDVSEIARFDLDILQINLLMRANAIEAASDYYRHGANSLSSSNELQSLASLTSGSDAGKLYQLYLSYYNDDNYADTVITAVMQRRVSAYADASRVQLSDTVRRVLQTLVPYLQIVTLLSTATEMCKDPDNQDPPQFAVDAAVAFFVGSIEGPHSGGSQDLSGMSLFALAKEFCADFDKCQAKHIATVNEYMLFSLADMKQWFDQEDCNSASSVLADSILPMLPVAMIQGTLSSSALNEQLAKGSPKESLSTAAILAEAVLPSINAVNPDSHATKYQI